MIYSRWGTLLAVSTTVIETSAKHIENFPWGYDSGPSNQNGGVCGVRSQQCSNSMTKTGCEECIMSPSPELPTGNCTGPFIPCPPEKWEELETGCYVQTPKGGWSVFTTTMHPRYSTYAQTTTTGTYTWSGTWTRPDLLNQQQCCGAAGTQSPIDALVTGAPVHPVKQPEQLIFGHAMGGGIKPGTQFCSKAFFVATQHGLKVSFDYSKYWPEVRFQWEKQHFGDRPHPHGVLQGPTPPPMPRCMFPKAGWGKGQNLVEFLFHSPSEHTLDGGFFPVEAQMIHMKGKKAGKGGLVIAVFITGSLDLKKRCMAGGLTPAQANDCKAAMFMEKIVNNMPFDTANNLVTSGAYLAKENDFRGNPDPSGELKEVIKLVEGLPGEFDPYSQQNNFVPFMRYFYNYFGSVSTPPCSVGVEWILNPNFVTVYDESLVKLRVMANNFQPNTLRHSTMASPLGVPARRMQAGAAAVDTAVQTGGQHGIPAGHQEAAPGGLGAVPAGHQEAALGGVGAVHTAPTPEPVVIGGTTAPPYAPPPPQAAAAAPGQIVWHKEAYEGWFTWDASLGTNNRPVQPLAGPACPVDPKAAKLLNKPPRATLPGQKVKTVVPTGLYSECPRQLWQIGTPRSDVKAMQYLDSSPAWASGLPNSLRSGMSSSGWLESDVMGSAESVNSMGSGSSGFYMALWKWAIVGAFGACMLAAISLCIYSMVDTVTGDQKGGKAHKDDGKKKKKDSARSVRDKLSEKEEDSDEQEHELMLVPIVEPAQYVEPVVGIPMVEYDMPVQGVYSGMPVATTRMVPPSGSYAPTGSYAYPPAGGVV